MLKNSIGDKTEFVTEIYVDGEEDAVVVVSSTREIDAVDDAMYEFKKLDIDSCWISRIPLLHWADSRCRSVSIRGRVKSAMWI